MNQSSSDYLNPGLLMAAAKMARNEPLSLAEEEAVIRVIGRIGEDRFADDGFPRGPSGDMQGWNGLHRTNWFNGRYLTAESLKRQDVYFDARSRLNAHALMPGIAWGLGLRVDGANATPVHHSPDTAATALRANGFPVDRVLELKRGLAFDHVGRPIQVSQAFRFSIDQLIGAYRKTPQRVVGGGTEFSPCVCLVPDPGGPSGGTAQVPTGPYLLVIEAAERADGEAKVMGDVCAGPAPDTCRADAWRGGFGLSLVRFPVDPPLRADLRTAWDLRGTLSAYYFDVFEHPLWRRWDPPFATDSGFCEDTGPGRHDGAAVALAMLYLGEDGSVLFLDQWIPRRTICATPGEDWHRSRFGAPPRAAAWARIHQFQCMLAESLGREPLAPGADGAGPSRLGLYQRGFRHIPPIGFLPLSPNRGDEIDIGVKLFETILNLADQVSGANGIDVMVSPLVAHALAQARDYFKGTNVICYGVVALHDDDILEDLNNCYDKDPIQLQEPHWLSNGEPFTDGLKGSAAHGYGAFGDGFFGVLDALFRKLGLEHLVNRRTEIVKLVVPLQGLTRSHPLLGQIPEDAMSQAGAWGVNQASTAGGAFANLDPGLFPQAAALAGIAQRLGLDMLPRHCVVYVKQRLVVLDLLFYVLEMIQLLIEVVSLARGFQRFAQQPAAPVPENMEAVETVGMPATNQPTTLQFRQAFQSQPQEKRVIVQAILAEPEVQATLVRAAEISGSDMAVAGRNEAFIARVATQEAELLQAGVADVDQRKRLALERVTDAYAAEHPGYQAMQLLAAVQPPAQTLGLVDKLAVPPGRNQGLTLADDLVGDGPTVFEDNASRSLYADMREKLAARKVKDLVPGADTELTAKALLERSPAEAEQLLGTVNYAKFRDAFSAERTAATEGAVVLAKGIPETLSVKLANEIAAGRSAEEAIVRVKADRSVAVGNEAVLDGAATLLRINGGDLAALNRLRRVSPR